MKIIFKIPANKESGLREEIETSMSMSCSNRFNRLEQSRGFNDDFYVLSLLNEFTGYSQSIGIVSFST